MSATHWPSRVGSDVRGRAQLVLTLLAATVGFEALAEEPVAAVFKAREVDFMYRSSDVHYPCHELQNRVAVILRAIGARDDIDVRATGCENQMVTDDRFGRDGQISRSDPFDRTDPFDRSDPFGRNRTDDRLSNRRNEQMVHVRVRLMTPVKVTPEVLKEIDKDKSRRELISRVTGNPMAAMNDAVVFPAQRQSVTLSRQTIRLEAEDCDLIDEMSKSVFRELGARVVRGAPNCGHGSRIAPTVTVEALLPVAMAPGKAPGEARIDPDPAATAPPEAAPSENKPESTQQEAAPAPTTP